MNETREQFIKKFNPCDPWEELALDQLWYELKNEEKINKVSSFKTVQEKIDYLNTVNIRTPYCR